MKSGFSSDTPQGREETRQCGYEAYDRGDKAGDLVKDRLLCVEEERAHRYKENDQHHADGVPGARHVDLALQL